MSAPQLLDLAPVARRKGATKALVVVDRSVCPLCGASTVSASMWEPALFYFGGFGATRRSTSVHCSRLFDRHCAWTLITEITEVSPRVGTA